MLLRRTTQSLILQPALFNQVRHFHPSLIAMPSSKGKPTDPELREELKEGELPGTVVAYPLAPDPPKH